MGKLLRATGLRLQYMRLSLEVLAEFETASLIRDRRGVDRTAL